MEITNFRDLERVGTTCLDYVYRATVDVTTRKWFFSRPVTVQKQVIREFAGAGWRWADGGAFCSGFVVENLEKDYASRKRFSTEKATAL